MNVLIYIARISVLLAVLAVIAGCGTTTVIKSNGGGRPVGKAGQIVTVRQGETLYSIARQHGLSTRDLAIWNNLNEPFIIYSGQQLQLYPGKASTQATSRPSSPQPPSTSSAPKPNTSPPPPPSSSSNSSLPSNSGFTWQWPANGTVVGTFVSGDATRQGVDISGVAGQPVFAASGGVVVYSGSGLVGYGELIIIKHNEQWLSAYGHNSKRLVSEGQSVKAGEQIAEMGRTGAARDMLHFEIRYNGSPIDPMRYLPKK